MKDAHDRGFKYFWIVFKNNKIDVKNQGKVVIGGS